MNWKDNFYQEVITPEEKLKHLDFNFKGKSVIDLGCNIGAVSRYVIGRRALNYMGCDNHIKYINEANIRFANNKNIVFVCSDILKPKSFEADVVFALGLLHHLKDSDIEILSKKIKCDTLIVEVPTSGDSKLNIRSTAEYEKLLSSFGKLTKVLPSGFVTPPVKREILIFEK